jgi:hypothetical protein
VSGFCSLKLPFSSCHGVSGPLNSVLFMPNTPIGSRLTIRGDDKDDVTKRLKKALSETEIAGVLDDPQPAT